MLSMIRNGTHGVAPFDGLLGLRREIDRVLDGMYGDMMPAGRAAGLPVDVVETPNGYEFQFEVPGFSMDELDVAVENGVLTVTAGRAESDAEERTEPAAERRRGRFVRSLAIPADAAVDEADAHCARGVLTVTLPKREESHPRRIEIRPVPGRRQVEDATR